MVEHNSADVRRVIVIDDNQAIHEDIRKILSNHDSADGELDAMLASILGTPVAKPQSRGPVYDLAFANQGQQGLRMVAEALEQSRPFQVAFVDMRMPPGWDGVETIERLWAADPLIQTVICSAYSDYSWSDIHRRLGDSDRLLILRKPFENAEICQLAAALTEKYRLARAARMKLEELEKAVSERTAGLKQLNEQLQQEIERRQRIEERLRHDALHDTLTGLPNRAMLMDRIEQCIKRKRREPDYQFAVLFLDLDDFKVVNDSLGHEAGDKLLVGVADRLAAAVRDVDSVSRPGEHISSRLGGDEFVVLLNGLSQLETPHLMAERIQRVMAEPFNIAGYEVVAGLSIGIATSVSDYARAADILRDADTAVYHAKLRGKHGYAIFDATMHAEVRSRLELEADLRKAIGTDQIAVHYQPIVSLNTGSVEGFEALVRWQHPTRGMISPCDFIPMAEATGLIVPLGLNVFRTACRQAKAWRSRFPSHQHLWISVNLSARQLYIPDLPDQLDAAVAAAGLDCSAIKLEITESVLVEQGDAASKAIQKLRDRGYPLAIDDFGTGYSSLSYLHQIPINAIKIDRAFVAKMDSYSRTYIATVQAILALAHNCNLAVIAEGVETAAQVVQLQTLGCDHAQGYYFSKPKAAESIEVLLRGQPSWSDGSTKATAVNSLSTVRAA